MPIQFSSDPYTDMLIFSGAGINYEAQLIRGLKGEAAENAKKKLQDSYEEYQGNLNIKYSVFLRTFEAYSHRLIDPEEAKLVAAKLKELAEKRIEEKESQYSCMRRIAHIIIQFFKLHGLRTKGERGLELASRIKKDENTKFITRLERLIFHSHAVTAFEVPPQDAIRGMKEEIDGLDEAEFKEVLNNIIFKEEKRFFGEKNKYVFYKNLNDEKKDLFEQTLLLREDDWFYQAFDIIEGAKKEDYHTFVTDEMVGKFQANPSPVLSVYNSRIDKKGDFEYFFLFLMEKTVQKYNREKDYENILYLFQELTSNAKRSMLNNPQVLNGEEKRTLGENVDLSSYLQ